jgi:hypothetical protein
MAEEQKRAFTAEELAELNHFKIRALAESLVFSENYFAFPNTTVTVCLITTHHGHHEIGSSYFPDVEHFTPEFGRFGAREDAMTKLQPIADFLFREKQYKDGAVLETIPVALPVPQEYLSCGVRYIDVPTPPERPERHEELAVEAGYLALSKLKEPTATEQTVGMGYEITREPIAGNITRPLKTGPGGVTFIAEEDLKEMDEAMQAVTEADIAEVITRMSAAVQADRAAKAEAAVKAEIADTSAALLQGGLITPEEHDKITGPDYVEPAPVHKGELIEAQSPAASPRENDSMVSGDGVELLSVQHPGSAEAAE